MLINFNEQQERKAPGMNNGTGEMSAKMFMDDNGKIIPCRIHKGGSIGMHGELSPRDRSFITVSVLMAMGITDESHSIMWNITMMPS